MITVDKGYCGAWLPKSNIATPLVIMLPYKKLLNLKNVFNYEAKIYLFI